MKIAATFPYSGDSEFVKQNAGLLVDARVSESDLRAAERAVLLAKQAHDEGKPSVVFASPRILNGLEDHGLDYFLVYPSTEVKAEWIDRARAFDARFANIAERMWDSLLDDLHGRRRARPLILGEGMLFPDVLQLQNNSFILKD